MNTKLIKGYVLVLFSLCVSCTNGFLDVIPDKSLAVPQTSVDLRAILDNTTKMSVYYPAVGEISANDYYITSNEFNSLTQITARNAYIWDDDLFNDRDANDWSYPYVTVFNANVVLEALANWDDRADTGVKDELAGAALFFRAYAFFSLSQLFCKSYDPLTAQAELGIPLRLDADLNKKSIRSSLAETYKQILEDATTAARLLPESVEMKTRPSRAAALGLLSRVYLTMGNYESALFFADSCMKSTSAMLIDYNTINPNVGNPFPRFNEEVIFHSALRGESLLMSLARIDSTLYDSYEDTDLRKRLYFEPARDQGYRFRGSYDGSVSLFGGIALDEIYFIKAECEIRAGNFERGINTLVYILSKRYVPGLEYNVAGMDDTVLLKFVLEHRRKSLIMRGLRWSDLRRLNREPDFAVQIVRQIDGESHVLLPNDNRYVLPIPHKVIQMTNMQQNER